MAILEHIEIVIEACLFQQLGMGPLLNDSMIVDHKHMIGFTNGAQAMSNDKGRPAFHQV